VISARCYLAFKDIHFALNDRVHPLAFISRGNLPARTSESKALEKRGEGGTRISRGVSRHFAFFQRNWRKHGAAEREREMELTAAGLTIILLIELNTRTRGGPL